MKNRFSTIDIFAALNELNTVLKGSRVGNIYDVNHRVYLLKFSRDEVKRTLLIESGIRFHLTTYEWPKSPAPSSFSMKLRKHTRNKILLDIQQLGVDRIVDFQFGFSSVLYHVIVEFYDRGNIFLCDAEYNILNALRPRTDQNTDVKFIVGQKYPVGDAKLQSNLLSSSSAIGEMCCKCKPSDPIKRLLIPHTLYGPSLIDHCLRLHGLSPSVKIQSFSDSDEIVSKVQLILQTAEEIFQQIKLGSGPSYESYITYKTETVQVKDEKKSAKVFVDFNPYKFLHIPESPFDTFPTFNEAVDCFFSLLEAQKIDAKTVQQERNILKKLENVRVDHEQRLKLLESQQIGSRRKGELIKLNLQFVDKALTVIRSALANKMTWSEVDEIVEEARSQNDPVASKITRLKLDVNKFEMKLSDDVYSQNYDAMSSESENEDMDSGDNDDSEVHTAIVEIDISKSAYANARVYFDDVRFATQKEQKTIEASKKAFENAEKATQLSLKQIDVCARIEKLRKTYWFEKFLWFISSDNMIVIGGHDQQQNELLVKKYLNKGDLYVHADIHGATSVIIKNPTSNPVPPRTLQEAASMAVCYSSAWDAKIWQSAWWVHADQVSKTAPSGEYLTTGSFMVRGKRNHIAQPQLVMGFGFLFCLEEQSIARHKGERASKGGVNDVSEVVKEGDACCRQQSLPGSISEYSEQDSTKGKESGEYEGDAMSQKEIDELFEDSSDEEEDDTKVNNQSSSLPSVETNSESVAVDNISVPIENQLQTLNENNVETSNSSVSQLNGKEEKPVLNDATVDVCESVEGSTNGQQQQHQMKRGHKNKLKKIKQKYADQDEEEREARMALLASAGPTKESKKKNKKNQKHNTDNSNQHNSKNRVKPSVPAGKIIYIPDETPDAQKGKFVSPNSQTDVNVMNTCIMNENQDEEAAEQDDNEEEQSSLLIAKNFDELTGQPVAEDELLFALPVCAPYSALSNYKFKVKLVPGTGKRGKVVKTALHIFSSMKETLPYEKTLINAVKDGDLSRNVPGKVKLSAPNLNRIKVK